MEGKPIRQCANCPWRVDADPVKIPNGYCVQKHMNLIKTIAEPCRVDLAPQLRMMACHHSGQEGAEFPCAGWLNHQLGVGNNIALRLALITGKLPRFEIVGEQHQRFEDTLPKERE